MIAKRPSLMMSLFFTTACLLVACNKSSFMATSEESADPQKTSNPNIGVGSIPVTGTDGITQVGGTCSPGGGDVSIFNGVNLTTVAPCPSNGQFEACTLMPTLGNGTVQVTQVLTSTTTTVSSETVNLSVLTEYPALTEINFAITGVQVVSSSSATITIQCMPGATITSTIYGANQLGVGGATCTTTGTFTFNVTLVPSLAQTGQRVVYITQITQSGSVTTVFVDVDNVIATHTCSITNTQSNVQICVNSAGTVTGKCKGGSPVLVQVNGTTQHVVTCSENDTFSANNVILTQIGGSNTISISQTTPFGTTCTAETVISNFQD